MNNKKNIFSILIIILISLILSLVGELLIFNRKAIFNERYKKELEVIDTKNIDNNDGTYITNDKNAYLILKGEKKYINKISFNYESINDFKWTYIVSNSYMKKEKKNKVSSIINKTVRKVDMKETEIIKIKLYNEGIKISNIEAFNELSINYSRLLFMTISFFSLLIIIYYFNYFKNNIDKAFLFLAISFGSLFIILTPVCLVTGSDDQIHFHKSYTLLDGKKSKWSYSGRYFDHLVINSYKNYRTNEEIELYKDFLNKNNNKKSTIKVDNMDSTIEYSELVYIPFSIGYKTAQLLGANFVNCIYISKLFNLIVYSIIMYFAIKIIPFAKRLIFMIGLFPASIYMASQFSYDSTIIAGMIISFSAFLKILKEKKVDFKYFMIFILGIVWASLPKAIYCPMLLLSLFIPNKWFESKAQAIMTKISICCLFLSITSTFVLPVLTTTVAGDSRIANTSVTGQLKYILNCPVGYIKLLITETIYSFDKKFFGFKTFSLLGYLNGNTEFFNLSNFLILASLLYYTFTDKIEKNTINKNIRIIIALILIMIWCLIWTALYLSWTPVAHPRILGVQSRYFVPILLPLLILFIPVGRKERKNNYSYYLYLLPIFTLSYSALYIILTLYK